MPADALQDGCLEGPGGVWHQAAVGGGRGVRFLQQYSQAGCRFLKRLSDLPRLELCETGTVKGDEAGPLGLTPSDMPGPFMCVFALTRPFLIHSLPPSAH